MNRESPNTRFVMERLQETSWEDRGYIYNLLDVEFFVERGGPKSFAEGMRVKQLQDRFPVEWLCIRREVEDNVHTSAEEFQRLLKEHEEALRAEEEEWEREQRRKELEEQRIEEDRRRRWLDMGGLA